MVKSYFKNFIVHKLKSKENITMIVAWQTFLIPLGIWVAASEYTPIFSLILGTVILVILSTLLIGIINTVIWSLCFLATKRSIIS